MVDQEEQKQEDIKLPDLNPLLKIFPAAQAKDGSPRWVIYYPASNTHFQIGWIEFECLARFHKCKTASALIEKVNDETTLTIDEEDVSHLIIFLSKSGLLNSGEQMIMETPDDEKQPLWKKAVHSYLFFTIPLIRPEKFLDAVYPMIKPFLTRAFWLLSIVLLIFGIVLTLPKIDAFLATFQQIFTMEGAILLAIVFTGIKIIHEFGHAFMAKHYGVSVPHMGLAFMVMYPIMYTEMSGSWRVTSQKARIYMGLAGVMTEIALAAVFLVYWHISSSVLGQSIAFSVVAISLLGSLFVNLNPFMRFDGYYVLSDYWGIENLHAKAIEHGKQWIRRVAFGLQEDIQGRYDEKTQRFLTAFGLGVIIYRFFLYLGIAFLVYYVFFKPLGFVMMMIELAWFIAIPVLKELQYIWSKKSEWLGASGAKIRFIIIAVIGMIFFFPVHSSIKTMAVMHPSSYINIYPATAAKIENLHVRSGQPVKTGDILLELVSPEQDKNIEIATLKLQSLQSIKQRERTRVDLFKERRGLIDEEIKEAQQALNALLEKQKKMRVIAAFDGVIHDLDPELHMGRFVEKNMLLFRLVDEDRQAVLTAYIPEKDIHRLSEGDKGHFTNEYALFARQNILVKAIEPVNAERIDWPELSAQYKGNVPTNEDKLLKSYYKVVFSNENQQDRGFVERGYIVIYGGYISPVFEYFKALFSLILRGFGLN